MDVFDVIFVDNSLIKTLVWGNTLQWKRETWILELGKSGYLLSDLQIKHKSQL